MITEVRPGFFQTTLPNGVTWSFASTDLKTAEKRIADEIKRMAKRQDESLSRKLWEGTLGQ